MASKAPLHGCHGEPGTAARPHNKRGGGRWGRGTSGWLSTGVRVPTAAAAAGSPPHQQTMTRPPGATRAELMVREIEHT